MGASTTFLRHLIAHALVTDRVSRSALTTRAPFCGNVRAGSHRCRVRP